MKGKFETTEYQGFTKKGYTTTPNWIGVFGNCKIEK